MLKHIVHDWDDESCVQILSNVQKALPPAGRALVLEQELPSHDGWHLAKAVDLEMLVDGLDWPGNYKGTMRFTSKDRKPLDATFELALRLSWICAAALTRRRCRPA